MNCHQCGALQQGALKVTPAVPGYFVISLMCNEDASQVEIFKNPVIAWALEHESFQPYPITIEGIDDDRPAILQPDGSVECPGFGSFTSINQWRDKQPYPHVEGQK